MGDFSMSLSYDHVASLSYGYLYSTLINVASLRAFANTDENLRQIDTDTFNKRQQLFFRTIVAYHFSYFSVALLRSFGMTS